MARPCIACGADGPLTKEHIMPQWLRTTTTGLELQKAPWPDGAHSVTRFNRDSGELEEQERGRRTSPFEMQVRAVCASCNSGWMSALEKAFKKVLERINAGADSLNEMDAWTAEAWAVKTAVMFQMHDPGSRVMPDGILALLSDKALTRRAFRVFMLRSDDMNLQARLRHFGHRLVVDSPEPSERIEILQDLSAVGVQGIGFLILFSLPWVDKLGEGLDLTDVLHLSSDSPKFVVPARAVNEDHLLLVEKQFFDHMARVLTG